MFYHPKIIHLAFQQRPLAKIHNRNAFFLFIPPEMNWSIDDKMWSLLMNTNYCSKHSIESTFQFLGFDFCFIMLTQHTILLASGPRRGTKLFYRIDDDSIQIQDHLFAGSTIIDCANSLNYDAIISFFGSTLVTGPFDICRTTTCINRDWRCVPNSHIICIDVCGSNELHSKLYSGSFDNIWNGFSELSLRLEDAIESARASLQRSIVDVSRLGPVCAEASGGIDSGIVFHTALKVLGKQCLGGISCNYPFFEFRREQQFRHDLYNHVKARCVDVDWRHAIPFARCNLVPAHDLPSVDSTNWSLYNATSSAAFSAGASVLLTGHAGDRVFLQSPFLKREISVAKQEPPFWFPRNMWRSSLIEAQNIHDHLYRSTTNGICGEWNGAMFEPAWNGRYGPIGTYLKRYRSGYLHRDFIRSMAYIWAQNPKLDDRIQKTIAYLVFKEELPMSIWSRPSKVNHVGITYRGARLWSKQLIEVGKRAQVMLDALGISRMAFEEALQRAVDGQDSANLYITLVMSILLWADSAVRDLRNKESVCEWNVNLEPSLSVDPEIL